MEHNDLSYKPTVVVLAGGKSHRFGSNKIFAKYQGVSLLEIIINTLEETHHKIILSGPKRELASFGFPVIEDRYPGNGPLQALRGILETIQVAQVLIVASDMPFIGPKVIQKLWTESGGCDICHLAGRDHLSPLPGIYSKTVLPVISRVLDLNRKDLKALFQSGLKIRRIEHVELNVLDPSCRALRNINTPEDFLAATRDPILT